MACRDNRQSTVGRRHYKKESGQAMLALTVVPVAGVEPARLLCRGILSPLCLPFHHTGNGVILTPNGKRVKNGNRRGGIRQKSRYPDKIGQMGIEISVDTLAVLPS